MSFLCPWSPSTPALSGAMEFYVFHSCPSEEKEHIGLPPEASGYCGAMDCPFLLWSFLDRLRGASVTLRWLQMQIWGGTDLSAWNTELTFHDLSSYSLSKMCQFKNKRGGAFVFFFKYVLNNSERDECSHILCTHWKPGDVVNPEKLQRTGPAVGWGEGSMISISPSLSSHHFSKTVLCFTKESEHNYVH